MGSQEFSQNKKLLPIVSHHLWARNQKKFSMGFKILGLAAVGCNWLISIYVVYFNYD